jgi:serine protease Do
LYCGEANDGDTGMWNTSRWRVVVQKSKPSLLALLTMLAGLSVLGGCAHERGTRDDPTRILPHPAFTRMKDAETTLSDIAERSMRAVVNISSTKVIRRQRSPFGSPFFDDPFFQHFFGQRGGVPQERRRESLGSGVIVAANGIVLTNNHVVEHAEKIRVTLADRRQFDAEIVGADPKSDVAVLRLLGEQVTDQLKDQILDLEPVSFGDSSRLRLGDVVLAIGNPFGVGQTVTMGIVSAKGRADMGIVDYEDFIQTDAAINPGNSGGALINMRGELVGINTAILSRSGGYQGIGFAIPSNMARPIMDSLLKHGKVIRGWLGLRLQDLTVELAKALGLSTTRGVLVSDVADSSPAERAGIRHGDVVLRINGTPVDSASRLHNRVAVAGAGSTITVDLVRKTEHKTVKVTLAEMPVTLGGLSPAVREKYDIPERITHGVVVEKILSDGPAAAAGIRPGDVILELNRAPIKTVAQFTRLYHEARRQLLLLMLRESSTVYILLNK